MLNKVKTLKGYKLQCIDGEIGKVKEFYFDDQNWTIRYLIADTGNWLVGRQVLISPYALDGVNKQDQYIVINLTKNQIENSPSLASDKPISRQYEEEYNTYYEWPVYWGDPNMGVTGGLSPSILCGQNQEKLMEPTQGNKDWDTHLRSTYEVSGYTIQATDGEIGHVEDFIIDHETLEIRYLVIATMNWWPGKKILVSPKWIERISWKESKVFVNLLRETIKLSPEYTEESLITRDYESKLHRHYNQQGYWIDKENFKKHSPL
ncbi:PRC-barrel domain-containing protein [Clostridium estertheticum]|uniref:Photosystem reaction center subunit H n=1 Tax=Clostridium estertheticum subsp. estertheticum TaxID=1552 RepID=A0A1J0GHM4_9CLOT|nr:PRC-barrel domain-containing protein [Clostridium estertheticum]APC40819.1 photosystem reaction center subunit H [Clostridium estertheticum subsp. estertheticum]MBZ9617335.1 PRC-barrel domain-containing protein [Clostridium estertheticum subsp. laramiense]WAG73021.1 PRC-barrel domain-containing protein [Clostridium estertheticum]